MVGFAVSCTFGYLDNGLLLCEPVMHSKVWKEMSFDY